MRDPTIGIVIGSASAGRTPVNHLVLHRAAWPRKDTDYFGAEPCRRVLMWKSKNGLTCDQNPTFIIYNVSTFAAARVICQAGSTPPAALPLCSNFV